jgi:hypothetical protein
MYHTLLIGSTDAGESRLQMHHLDEHGKTAYLVSYPSEIKGFQKEKVFDDYASAKEFFLGMDTKVIFSTILADMIDLQEKEELGL